MPKSKSPARPKDAKGAKGKSSPKTVKGKVQKSKDKSKVTVKIDKEVAEKCTDTSEDCGPCRSPVSCKSVTFVSKFNDSPICPNVYRTTICSENQPICSNSSNAQKTDEPQSSPKEKPSKKQGGKGGKGKKSPSPGGKKGKSPKGKKKGGGGGSGKEKSSGQQEPCMTQSTQLPEPKCCFTISDDAGFGDRASCYSSPATDCLSSPCQTFSLHSPSFSALVSTVKSLGSTPNCRRSFSPCEFVIMGDDFDSDKKTLNKKVKVEYRENSNGRNNISGCNTLQVTNCPGENSRQSVNFSDIVDTHPVTSRGILTSSRCNDSPFVSDYCKRKMDRNFWSRLSGRCCDLDCRIPQCRTSSPVCCEPFRQTGRCDKGCKKFGFKLEMEKREVKVEKKVEEKPPPPEIVPEVKIIPPAKDPPPEIVPQVKVIPPIEDPPKEIPPVKDPPKEIPPPVKEEPPVVPEPPKEIVVEEPPVVVEPTKHVTLDVPPELPIEEPAVVVVVPEEPKKVEEDPPPKPQEEEKEEVERVTVEVECEDDEDCCEPSPCPRICGCGLTLPPSCYVPIANSRRPPCFEACSYPFVDVTSRSYRDPTSSSRGGRNCRYDTGSCRCCSLGVSCSGGGGCGGVGSISPRRGSCFYQAIESAAQSCENMPILKRWKYEQPRE